jgi:hypothetical protein
MDYCLSGQLRFVVIQFSIASMVDCSMNPLKIKIKEIIAEMKKDIKVSNYQKRDGFICSIKRKFELETVDVSYR